MRILERIVDSVGEPGKHDVWCRVNGDGVELLVNVNGKWIPVTGGCDCSGGSVPAGDSSEMPEDPVVGQLFYDTESGELKVYDGEDWSSVGGSGGSGEKVLYEFDLEDLDKLSSQLKAVSNAASEGNAFNVVFVESDDSVFYSSVNSYVDTGYGVRMYYASGEGGEAFFVYKSGGVDDFIVSVISRLQEDDPQEMILFPGADNIFINSSGYLTLNVLSLISENTIDAVAVDSDGVAMICITDKDGVITGFTPNSDYHPSPAIYITEEELNYLIGTKIGSAGPA